ncbi:uncharacterized protein J8A68_001390 [[Candida] subhashii]|uniref:PH domain-containing protein n=1 Tax=[Candida] subhashii TaxID=561895 RepID=A0A8J5QQY7_9ASCO|nr:uncharacterized protein J8A68_001390 [[Candida] subhashii]KAG7665081.1 hypothetical protein J8A68_001390 [[Candida] subhashii]
MRNSIDQPSREYLSNKAQDQGLEVIESNELSNMRHEIEQPSVKYLKSKAHNVGMDLIASEELSSLKATIDSPSLEFLESKAAQKDMKLLNINELEHLKKLAEDPEIDHIEKFATKKDLVVLPLVQHQELIEKSANPDQTHIENVASKRDLSVIPLVSYKELVEKSENPDIPHIEEVAAKRNCKVVPNYDYDKLVASAEIVKNPPAEFIKSHGAELGFKVIAIDEFNELSHLEGHAKEHGQTLISNEEYKELMVKANKSLDEMAEENQMIVLDKNSFEELSSKANKSLNEFAEESGMVVLEKDKHAELVNKANKTLDEIAAESNLVMLPEAAYEDLSKKANRTVDDLAEEGGKIAVDKTQYEQLVVKANKSLDELAEENGKISVDKDFHQELVSKANRSLDEFAEESGKVAIDKNEHQNLIVQAEKSLEELAEEVQKVVLTKSDHEELLTRANKSLEDHAMESGMIAISNDDYETLVSKSNRTIEQLAEESHMIALSNEDHTDLVNRANKSLQEMAQENNMILLNKEEYEDLIRKVDKTFDEHAAERGMAIISVDQHKKLEETAGRSLEVHADEEGKCVISKDELSSFKEQIENPTLEYLKECCRRHLKTLVSEEEYELLQSKANQPIEEKAEEAGLKVIPIQELKDLERKIESPDIEYIKSKASGFGYETVDSEEYSKLVAYFHKPVEEIAKEANLVPLEKEKYDDLIEKAETPSLDHIHTIASIHNHVAIPKEEYDHLNSSIKSPDLSFIEEKARDHERVVVPVSEYRKLVEDIQEPIEQKAAKKNMTLIPIADLQGLKSKLDSPDLDYLRDKARQLESVVVPESEFNSLTKLANESLEERAEKSGMRAIEQEKLDTLERAIENPSVEFLKEKASSHGLEVIAVDEVSKLRQESSDPSIEQIVAHAERKEHVVVPKEEFMNMEHRANKPIEEKASEASLKLMTVDEYNELERLAKESLEERAAKGKKQVVDNDELNRLQQISTNPTIDQIMAFANAKQHIVISEDVYTEMQQELDRSLEDKAHSKGLKVVPVGVFTDLSKHHESPSFEFLKDKSQNAGYEMVSKKDFENLSNAANESLEVKAAKENKVAIPKSEYEESVVNPSIEKLKEYAQRNDHVIIPVSDFNGLESLAKESIYDKAEKENVRVLSLTEYDDLNDRVAHPPLDLVSKIAEENDQLVISKYQYDELRNLANETVEDKLVGTDLKLLKVSEYDELLVKAHKPSIEHIEKNAAAIGFSVVAADELTDLKRKAMESLEEKASASGFVVVNKSEYELIQSELDKSLEDRAAEGNYVLVNKNELEELRYNSGQSLEERAKMEGMIVMTTDEFNDLFDSNATLERRVKELEISGDEKQISRIKKELANVGYFVLPISEYNKLQEGNNKSSEEEKFEDVEPSFILTPEELQNSASRMDMVIMTKEEYAELSQVDQQKIEEYAKNSSLVLVPEVEILKLKQTLAEKDSEIHQLKNQVGNEISKEAVINKSDEFGLVFLEKDEYHELKSLSMTSKHPINDESELETKARELNKVIIDRDEYEELEYAIEALNDRERIADAAKTLGLLAIPETAYVATTTHPKPETTPTVKVVPTSYFNQLLKLKTSSLEKASDETFKKHAEARGFIHKDDVPAPAPAPPIKHELDTIRERHSTSDSNVSRYIPPQPQRNAPSSPESPIVARKGGLSRLPQTSTVRSDLSGHLSPSSGSINDSLKSNAMFSIATDVSLTDKVMIPAITQVMIGEYLFKYYRKLGAFSAISDTRHERYFWVHPYSLTLYWSENNPVLAISGSIKTRSAAIVKVESVDDNNPLPTGLYFKSIVVHSTDGKKIKITCATRQRHNIWYNALRYLISRNLDELTVDEEVNADELKSFDETSPRSESSRNLQSLMETGDRRAFPRPPSKRMSSSVGNLRDGSTGGSGAGGSSSRRVSRFSSGRK